MKFSSFRQLRFSILSDFLAVMGVTFARDAVNIFFTRQPMVERRCFSQQTA